MSSWVYAVKMTALGILAFALGHDGQGATFCVGSIVIQALRKEG